MTPLSASFYRQSTEHVARDLLGHRLISVIGGHRVAGTIVETEAYLAERDPACHAHHRRTPRTEVMFGPAGRAYVFPIHARFCFNIVTETVDRGCAVLIRAIVPEEGQEIMRQRRGVEDQRRLTTGPACLCEALGIDRDINGLDLTRTDRLWIEPGTSKAVPIKTTGRIGISRGQRRRLRFCWRGNPFVSGPRTMRE